MPSSAKEFLSQFFDPLVADLGIANITSTAVADVSGPRASARGRADALQRVESMGSDDVCVWDAHM